MSADVEELVGALVRTDLSALDPVGLQQHAAVLQRAVGRLTGLLHATLGELHARHDEVVVANPGSSGPALYRPVHQWWRDAVTLTGQQAGQQVRHSTVLRDLPVIASAVTAGDLSPEHARVLARLHGPISLVDLQDSQSELVQVAAAVRREVRRWDALSGGCP